MREGGKGVKSAGDRADGGELLAVREARLHFEPGDRGGKLVVACHDGILELLVGGLGLDGEADGHGLTLHLGGAVEEALHAGHLYGRLAGVHALGDLQGHVEGGGQAGQRDLAVVGFGDTVELALDGGHLVLDGLDIDQAGEGDLVALGHVVRLRARVFAGAEHVGVQIKAGGDVLDAGILLPTQVVSGVAGESLRVVGALGARRVAEPVIVMVGLEDPPAGLLVVVVEDVVLPRGDVRVGAVVFSVGVDARGLGGEARVFE